MGTLLLGSKGVDVPLKAWLNLCLGICIEQVLGLPSCLEYSRSVEGSMNVGHCWCEGEWGSQLYRWCPWFSWFDLGNSMNSRCRVLCHMAQHCWDGRICMGHLRLEVQEERFPFQILMSISLPELVVMSDRVRTWRYSLHRLNFFSSGRVRSGNVMSMRRSRTCVLKLQSFSLLRGKYHGMLNLRVPWKSLRNYHEVATQDGGARVDIWGREKVRGGSWSSMISWSVSMLILSKFPTLSW